VQSQRDRDSAICSYAYTWIKEEEEEEEELLKVNVCIEKEENE